MPCCQPNSRHNHQYSIGEHCFRRSAGLSAKSVLVPQKIRPSTYKQLTKLLYFHPVRVSRFEYHCPEFAVNCLRPSGSIGRPIRPNGRRKPEAPGGVPRDRRSFLERANETVGQRKSLFQ